MNAAAAARGGVAGLGCRGGYRRDAVSHEIERGNAHAERAELVGGAVPGGA